MFIRYKSENWLPIAPDNDYTKECSKLQKIGENLFPMHRVISICGVPREWKNEEEIKNTFSKLLKEHNVTPSDFSIQIFG